MITPEETSWQNLPPIQCAHELELKIIKTLPTYLLVFLDDPKKTGLYQIEWHDDEMHLKSRLLAGQVMMQNTFYIQNGEVVEIDQE